MYVSICAQCSYHTDIQLMLTVYRQWAIALMDNCQYVRVREHIMSQNERTTFTSILRALMLLKIQYII